MIGPVFARVTVKRVAFVAKAPVEIGFKPAAAKARAVAAMAAYLGFLRLARDAPGVVGTAAERARMVALVVEHLLRPA